MKNSSVPHAPDMSPIALMVAVIYPGVNGINTFTKMSYVSGVSLLSCVVSVRRYLSMKEACLR